MSVSRLEGWILQGPWTFEPWTLDLGSLNLGPWTFEPWTFEPWTLDLTSSLLSFPHHAFYHVQHRTYAIAVIGSERNEAFDCIQGYCTALRLCLRGKPSRRGVQYSTTIVLILSILFLNQLLCLVQNDVLFRT